METQGVTTREVPFPSALVVSSIVLAYSAVAAFIPAVYAFFASSKSPARKHPFPVSFPINTCLKLALNSFKFSSHFFGNTFPSFAIFSKHSLTRLGVYPSISLIASPLATCDANSTSPLKVNSVFNFSTAFTLSGSNATLRIKHRTTFVRYRVGPAPESAIAKFESAAEVGWMEMESQKLFWGRIGTTLNGRSLTNPHLLR